MDLSETILQVYHQQTEKTTPNHPKASGGCGLLMARGILLILHTLYWVSSFRWYGVKQLWLEM